MNIVGSVRSYVTRMIDECGPGMKVLLMDKETTSIISVTFAQSELLQKEVFLFERLDVSSREPVKHMKCLCFIRPNQENLEQLSKELRSPRYGSYHIVFSNIVQKRDLKTLAEADEKESVREVHEFFADFLALAPHLFSIGIPNIYDVQASSPAWDARALQRSASGVCAALLALRKLPVIRYASSSPLCQKLAEVVHQMIVRESGGLFDMRTGSDAPPLLLIVDRRDDAVTPLLLQVGREFLLNLQ
jgi:vacuolar protein sorting-associated protein 45